MLAFLMVIGGLALFLYGITMLSQGMEQLAGSKIQQWLDKATNHPLKGATFGAVATALLQSSGLLMVTMIGLINAGLLNLPQAIGVMLGQEIGTTITGQVVAFNVGDIRFIALALGFILLEFGRERKWQRYGQILLGFGIMFTGREVMAGAVKPLATDPTVAGWLAAMAQKPLLGVLAGMIITAIMQSSTATTGLVITMGASGVITLPAAIGFIYGANIGSCITGLLAAIQSPPSGRRASIAQITINVIGVLLFLPFLVPYAGLLENTSPSLARQIANAHTIFNVTVSVIMLPFIRPLARFAEWLVPERQKDLEPKVTEFIDSRLHSAPSFAINQASRELDRMGQVAASMLELSADALLGRDNEKGQEVLRLEREVVDPLCNAIERFVDNVIAEGGIDTHERSKCFQLKNINVDLERVADHTENLAEAAQDRIYHQVDFSEEALEDLRRVFEQAGRSLRAALHAFQAHDQELAKQACRLEDEMDHLTLSVRQGHLQRVRQGICNPEADVLFVETLRNLERISDHADNIALSVLRKS